MHTKQGCKDFEINNYREYHDMYVQSSTLLLADVFGNFEHVCAEICQLDLAKKKCSSWTSMASSVREKKTKIKVDFLSDVYMLLMVETQNRGYRLSPRFKRLIYICS